VGDFDLLEPSGILSVLLDDVASTSSAEPEFQAAAQAVRAAVVAGQRSGLAAGAGGGPSSLSGPVRVAPTRGTPRAAEPQILRRDLPLQPPTGPGALPPWAVGRAARTLGPFRGSLGQPVSIDVFDVPATTTMFRRASVATPFLVVAGPAITWAPGGAGLFTAGGVWLAAQLLDPAAPADGWVGLAVDGGTLTGALPTPGPDGVLVLPDAAHVVLGLTLAPGTPPAPPAGPGPGGDARAATVDLPATVEVAVDAAVATITMLAPARLTAYGATVRLDGLSGAAGYVADLSAVLVPTTADVTHWSPGTPTSTLTTLAGIGTLNASGWALPVTRGAVSSLGQPAGGGSLALGLAGLTLTLPGVAAAVPLGDAAWLVAAPGLLTVATDAGVGAGVGGAVLLYPDPAGRVAVGGRIAYRCADALALRYLTASAGNELLVVGAALDVSLDRPVTADGARVALTSPQGILAFDRSATGTVVLAEGATTAAANERLPLALDNALLALGAPGLLVVRADVQETAPGVVAHHGAAAVLFPLLSALPMLPDPYVSTFVPAARRGAEVDAARTSSGVLARLDWDATTGPATPALTFSLWPSVGATASLPTVPPAPAPGPRVQVRAAAGGKVPDAVLLQELAAMADDAGGAAAGPIALLDVSGNADQFGVRYGGSNRTGQPGDAGAGPTIEGLSIVAPANTVRVITLPAVQWEPVNGPDAGPFSPMGFPDSGGETAVAARSVRLVEAAPRPAIDALVADYTDAAAPGGAVAAVSFPFGIRAVALLQPPSRVALFGSALDLHRPGFSAASVTGGHQLRATAPRRVLGPGLNPSFPGATVQLSNGLHNGVAVGLSPIDPLTDIFNGDFAPGGVEPQVPVSRFEIAGYGESVFSDWTDETDVVPSISEVRFDVLVGRTSVEIVQGRSLLYPYAVGVIRTIKLLRDNAGRVRRTDSGWQATTDGRYRWPRPDTRTHPGVVRGVTQVLNIRDTGLRWTTSAGTELMAVRFDCHVDLEGRVSGGGADGVPSHDQLGFVQISVNPQPGMAASEFAELIDTFGPMGGALDAVVDLGGTGQRTRAAHVGVGVTQALTGPEFAMAAWGSPLLPTGGAWSVVRRPTGDPSPRPVDATLGVPVVRAGYAGAPPDPTSPYRFADPADLATPNTPAVDYALLHATNTQRTLYPRPKVELTGPRAAEITSTQPPLLADAFLMATAVSAFPPVGTAIVFPDSDYGLRDVGGGALALDLAHNDFPVTGPDRVLQSGAGNTTFVRYRDESGTPSTVHLEVDSSAPVPWQFSVNGLEVGFATSILGEVLRFTGDERASAVEPGRFTNGTVHFGGALSAVQVFVDFLGRTRMRDLPIGGRNQPSLEIALKIPIVGGPGEPEDIDVGIGTLADAGVTVGVKVDLASGDTSVKFELDGIITGRTPYPPLVAAGQVKFEIETSAAGNVFKFTLGLGFGIQADIGPFKAEAYYFENFYFVAGTNEIGFGIGEEIKASIDLGVVSAEIDVEAAALMIVTSCDVSDTTLWLVAQLTIAVDITIAWVIDINFEYQLQSQANLDGGPCPAPMV
jgi:hypothetical protein